MSAILHTDLQKKTEKIPRYTAGFQPAIKLIKLKLELQTRKGEPVCLPAKLSPCEGEVPAQRGRGYKIKNFQKNRQSALLNKSGLPILIFTNVFYSGGHGPPYKLKTYPRLRSRPKPTAPNPSSSIVAGSGITRL